MKVDKLAHIGIAVSDIDSLVQVFEKKLGLKCSMRKEVQEHNVEVAVFPIGDTAIELLKPINPDSSIKRFIDKKGPGLHHIAFEVDNIAESIQELESSGVNMIDKKPRIGAQDCPIAFIHPESMGGILIELEEDK
ncbi:MAG: methylmalonyl-CoA epimerase [candidate division Zixibacteria bacterium]|nr:methylmalonyl-CoA epimerase [candidate division Zixibacteria bacterium]